MLTISSGKLNGLIEIASLCESEIMKAAATTYKADLPISPPHRTALVSRLRQLNKRELEEVLALLWIGRGDFAPDEWADASAQAHEHFKSCTDECLSDLPLLPEYIEEALSRLKRLQIVPRAS